MNATPVPARCSLIPSGMLEPAVTAYVECALWASADHAEDGSSTPLDENFDSDDIAEEALAEIKSDVAAFLASNADDVRSLEAAQVGHDFFLTRNRHGAGFWDRGLGEVGERLTKAAHAYGESELYVGDDGKLYV